jgi:hypothetical protein
MEVKGTGLEPQRAKFDFKGFPKFKYDRFDPDIDLVRKGDGYRYATKSEKRKRLDRIKKQKIEISNKRRKGLLQDINLLIGKQLFKNIRSEKDLRLNGKNA